jgi:hypothetical protein
VEAAFSQAVTGIACGCSRSSYTLTVVAEAERRLRHGAQDFAIGVDTEKWPQRICLLKSQLAGGQLNR